MLIANFKDLSMNLTSTSATYHRIKGVGKVQGAGAGWTVGKVRSPECRSPALSPTERLPW
jgi:hypothetical protein